MSLTAIEEEVPNIRTDDGIRRGSMSVGPRWKQKGQDPSGDKKVNKLNFLEDETFLRRLKQKNYGKWYLEPEQYSRKINILNTELTKL